MLKKGFLLCCVLFSSTGFSGYRLINPIHEQTTPQSIGQGAQKINNLLTVLKMDKQTYHFYATNKGIYSEPAWHRRHFIAYPQGINSQQIIALNSGSVQGKPQLMLAAKNNQAYLLTLTQPFIWKIPPMPDQSHGSYTLHDFLVTPTGQYYLATSNGLYQNNPQVTIPFRAQFGQWHYRNNFIDAHFKRLAWLNLPQQQHPTICGITAHSASCKIDNQWQTVSKSISDIRQPTSYQLQQSHHEKNAAANGFNNQLPPELNSYPGVTATLNYGNGYLYLFLKDGQYLHYDINAHQISKGYPASTSGGWHGITNTQAKQIRAVFNYGNGKTYFFLDDGTYLRYDIKSDHVDANYPMSISAQWHGISDTDAKQIIAAVNYGNGKIYFFLKNNTYLRYDIKNDKVDPGYPSPTDSGGWNGLNLLSEKSLSAAYSLTNNSYGFLFDTGAAPLGRDITMDAYFADGPSGQPHSLYSNGNQQLPLYVAICPKGDDQTPISDTQLDLVKQYLLIKDANNNQAIGFNTESNGALYTYTANDYKHGLFSPNSINAVSQINDFKLNASGSCQDPSLTKVLMVYLQSNSPDTSKSIYAALNYTDAHNLPKTIDTHKTSTSTTFNLVHPVYYKTSDLAWPVDKFWAPGGDTLWNDRARVYKGAIINNNVPRLYKVGVANKGNVHSEDFFEDDWIKSSRAGILDVHQIKKDTSTRRSSIDVGWGPCVGGPMYSESTDTSLPYTIYVLTSSCVDAPNPFPAYSIESYDIYLNLTDEYGNETKNLNVGKFTL